MANLSARKWMSKYQWCYWESSGISWTPKYDAKQFFLAFFLPCIFKL